MTYLFYRQCSLYYICYSGHHTDTFEHTEAPFDVEVFVSGFSSRVSGPGFGTRAGKTFLRLAKSNVCEIIKCGIFLLMMAYAQDMPHCQS